MNIGDKIKQRRKELNMTQEQLAKKLGYTSRTAISNVEKGKEDLSTKRCRKFAEALGVEPSYFIDVTNNYSDDSLELIRLFKQLSDENKRELLDFAKFLFCK